MNNLSSKDIAQILKADMEQILIGLDEIGYLSANYEQNEAELDSMLRKYLRHQAMKRMIGEWSVEIVGPNQLQVKAMLPTCSFESVLTIRDPDGSSTV